MRFIYLVLLILIASPLITGCDFAREIITDPSHGKTNKWVGEWEIVSIDGLSIAEVVADGAPHDALEGYGDVYFFSDGTWYSYVDASFTDDGITIGMYFHFDGTYTVSGDRFTLTLDGEEELFTDENGSWELEADTLILYFDDGSVIVLQEMYGLDEPEIGSID